MIWFTGHGVHHSGGWAFKDGEIKFKDIFELYLMCFRHRLLYLVCDCCYAGHWIDDCAKTLDGMGIPACGHKAKEAGIMIKIFTAASWNEIAYDGVFSVEGVTNMDGYTTFWVRKNITPSNESKPQTTASGDFTHITCLHSQSCHFSDVPKALQWTWQCLTYKDSRDRILIHTVRGKDGGRPAWHVVLVNPNIHDAFKQKVRTGTVDVTDFGHVLHSGWGEDPPKRIDDLIRHCNPFDAVCGNL